MNIAFLIPTEVNALLVNLFTNKNPAMMESALIHSLKTNVHIMENIMGMEMDGTCAVMFVPNRPIHVYVVMSH